MPSLLIALPNKDFDVTEVVQPWNVFRQAGAAVHFATEGGAQGVCDPLLLRGVIFGQLGARPESVALYAELEQDPAFQAPRRYADVDVADYDVLVLPGGHAQGMRQYLESTDLQALVLRFRAAHKLIGAICHGALVVARTLDPATGRSLAYGKRMTCLPYFMEALAYAATFWKLGRYYRTYPAYVEAEVRQALGPGTFERGPRSIRYEVEHVVEDGLLVTARWPGDARAFGERLLARARGAASATAPSLGGPFDAW